MMLVFLLLRVQSVINWCAALNHALELQQTVFLIVCINAFIPLRVQGNVKDITARACL